MWLIFTFWVFHLIVVQKWISEIRIWTYFLHVWLWFIDLKDPRQVTDALQLTGASLDFGDYGVVGERLFPCSRLNHSHHPERWGDTWPVHQKDKDIEVVLGRLFPCSRRLTHVNQRKCKATGGGLHLTALRIASYANHNFSELIKPKLLGHGNFWCLMVKVWHQKLYCVKSWLSTT